MYAEIQTIFSQITILFTEIIATVRKGTKVIWVTAASWKIGDLTSPWLMTIVKLTQAVFYLLIILLGRPCLMRNLLTVVLRNTHATYTPRSMRHTGSPLQSVTSYDPSYLANRTVCNEDGGVSFWSTTTFNDSYQHAEIFYSDFGSPLEVMEYVSYLHRPIPSNSNGVVIKVEASTVSRGFFHQS